MGLNDNKEVESGGFRCHSDVEDENNEVRSEMFLRFPFWEESETIMHKGGMQIGGSSAFVTLMLRNRQTQCVIVNN